MLVDTHCHLGSRKFDDDRGAVVERARSNGVTTTVVVAESEPSSRRAVEIAREFDLYSTAGVHPHDASTWDDRVAASIEEQLEDPRVVAVGEAGLDYHYDYSPREDQRTAFADQLALAARFKKPIVVHSRSCDEDMAAMLRDTDATVILHSFNAGPEVFAAGRGINAYMSFSGMVTFKSWTDLEAVRETPEDRLMVETDAPFLAPVPFRGKRNEPSYVVQVAERVAEIRGSDQATISRVTTRNAIECFNLSLANPEE
jgi:TatD DNase family protein